MRAEQWTRAGGPAFPVADKDAGVVYAGMTLRDYFAAKAMQAAIVVFADEPAELPIPNGIAAKAYEVADAMLKARES